MGGNWFVSSISNTTLLAFISPVLIKRRINRLVTMLNEAATVAKFTFCMIFAGSLVWGSDTRVRLSVGQAAAKPFGFSIAIHPGSTDSAVHDLRSERAQAGDLVSGNTWKGHAGGGHVDSAVFTVSGPDNRTEKTRSAHVMWTDLIEHSDADTARRLLDDPAFRYPSAQFTLLFDDAGTRGFTVSIDQMRKEKALWIPAYDAFLTLGDEPVSFEAWQKSAASWRGQRTLEKIGRDPEASYEQYASQWEDMGDPAFTHPHQPLPGHIAVLSWDSTIAKFGVDRAAGVWNDYGNPDRFRFWFNFGDLTQGVTRTWKSQRLDAGLPVITTTFEDGAIRYEVEQFAYPLNGVPRERNGEIAMVLLQKLRITNLSQTPRTIPVTMTHLRALPKPAKADIAAKALPDGVTFSETSKNRILLSLQGIENAAEWHETHDYQTELRRFDVTVSIDLPPSGRRELIVKLPSPMLDANSAETLQSLAYDQAREATIRFWSSWVDRGTQFRVPEQAVNDMFRTSLWHALMLPRRHGGEREDVNIDLPYSNFAYDQTGIPWPGVQSIYVDYMTYELRGYNVPAIEELLDEFRLNQDANGHVSGFANWMMYTPSMLYATAQHFLLTRDRNGFDRLLPFASKALEWCLSECRRAGEQKGSEQGLVEGPLNDGTGNGVWALNQAYMYAGLERFGTALERIGDSRAGQTLQAAKELQASVARSFAHAAALSTVVQLKDHTWQPYVPSEALTPRRLVDLWFPTDVDVGPVHMLRLKVLPADGDLASFLLNDHEDNLYLRGLGMANEPVYMPQAMAYLIRDDPKAAIRAFYSQMACAFSQTVYEPVEHRWMHGQYFGPPSTDGAWFEIYRNLLVREVDDHTLFLGQAAPRKWLEDGKVIEVSRAPTYFGDVSFRIESHAASRKIVGIVDMQGGTPPRTLLVRFRHPESLPLHAVTVNGRVWTDFDVAKEWVRISNPAESHYTITADY